MNIKTNLKILIILGIMLLVVLVFNTNSVQASTVINADDLQNILDKIPNEMSLDIPEIEYEKANKNIFETVKNILKNENLSTCEEKQDQISITTKIKELTTEEGYDIKFIIRNPSIYFGKKHFEQVYITISAVKGNTFYGNYYKKKIIKIKYNNSSNYNSSDEQYVKNIKVTSPKYYEVPLEFLSKNSEDAWKEFFNIAGQYYTKQISDTSIEVKADAGAGDGGINIVTEEGGTSIGLFKNGILYDIRKVGAEISVPVINVPSSVDDSNMNDYVAKQISKYNKILGENIVSIKKGTKDYLKDLKDYSGIDDIEDGYTISFNSTAEEVCPILEGVIIIRKEKSIEATDKITNIKLDTTTDIVPSNTVLDTKEIQEENALNEIKENLKEISDKFIAYDITLKNNNVAIQPSGKVTISIPIPENFDKTKIVVFRIENDGTKIKYDSKIEGNFAIIETDHFSTYVLAENNIVTNNKKDNTQISSDKINKGEKDQTPKTGTVDIINYVLITMALAGIGIIVLKKNLK